MSSHDDDKSYPDLTKGIPAKDVPKDGVFTGQVGDDTVLLAHVGGEIVAVSATCTHWNGPLGEGLRVGDTVRCPWHHACFDLKTGAAVKAPAMSPLDRWRVESKDGQVTVAKKLPAMEPPEVDSARHPKAVVIVGGGAAGFAAAQRLRDLGYAGTLTMLSDDKDPPCDRPNVSKDYLSGDADPAWMPLKGEDFYEENKITLRTATRVEAIDAKAKRLTLQGGESVAYDALLLATGAAPNRPDTPGLDGANVHLLRTLGDGDSLIEAAKSASKVAVIGSSFIGLEAAASLKKRGLEVDVIAPEDVPLARQFGDEVGKLVKAEHEKQGVRFHLGRKVKSYDGKALTLDDGSAVAADLIVVGIGVKPRLELAEAAGLKLDKGVVVDKAMRTSDGAIFAAGDIARYPSPVGGPPIRVEHWVLAERQGQIAAAAMLGLPAELTEPPFFWTTHFDLSVSYVGHAEGWDRIDVDGSVKDADAELRYVKDGRVMAVATINRDLALLEAERDMEADAG